MGMNLSEKVVKIDFITHFIIWYLYKMKRQVVEFIRQIFNSFRRKDFSIIKRYFSR